MRERERGREGGGEGGGEDCLTWVASYRYQDPRVTGYGTAPVTEYDPGEPGYCSAHYLTTCVGI